MNYHTFIIEKLSLKTIYVSFQFFKFLAWYKNAT